MALHASVSLRKKVEAAKKRLNCSQNQIARELGIDTGNFTKFMQGTKRPGLDAANAIWRRFGISTDRWEKLGT